MTPQWCGIDPNYLAGCLVAVGWATVLERINSCDALVFNFVVDLGIFLDACRQPCRDVFFDVASSAPCWNFFAPSKGPTRSRLLICLLEALVWPGRHCFHAFIRIRCLQNYFLLGVNLNTKSLPCEGRLSRTARP